MGIVRYEMLRGLAYRSIRHDDMRLYTRRLPIIFGLITGGLFVLMPNQPMLLGKDGLLVMVLSVLATLPGFYFAGLAAVATFNGPNMDVPMPAPTPKLKILVSGNWYDTDLSRRQFLSYLFSYLVFISFSSCLIIVAVNAAAPLIYDFRKVVLGANLCLLWTLGRGLSIILFAVLVGSMIATTLQGMFFLSERIHQP